MRMRKEVAGLALFLGLTLTASVWAADFNFTRSND